MTQYGMGVRFRRLWIASGSSAIGDGMVLVAFPLLALEFTRNPLLVATVAVCGQAPAILVGLPIGVVADRMNQRRLLLGIEIVRFLVLISFSASLLAGAGSLPLLYITAILLGVLSVSFDVVVGASLPSVVRESDLVAANTRLLSVELTGEELVGQAAGGAAFTLARSIPFLVDAVSFIFSALLLRGAVEDIKPERAPSSAWKDLRRGLTWFSQEPVIRLLTGLVATLAFCQAVVFGVLVLYATSSLGLRGFGYGVLLAAAATGNLIAAPLAPRVHDRLGSAGTIALAGVLAALAYPALAVTHSSVGAAAALLVETAAVLMGNVASRSLRQSFVPSSMQGRATAAFQTILLVSVPLGGLAGGVASAAVGIRDTFLAAGVLQLLLVALLAPRLRSRLAGLKGAGPEGRQVGGPLPEGGMAAVRIA